jgi:hypothetical protein
MSDGPACCQHRYGEWEGDHRSKDTTTLASAGTQLNTAEQKFNGISSSRKKPKRPPLLRPRPQPPQLPIPNCELSPGFQRGKLSGTTNKVPRKPAGPAPAGAAGVKLTANGQPASPSTATKSVAGTEVAGTSGTPTFTLMPDGDYMVGYAGTGAGAQTTHAKVKKVKQISPSATSSAANPPDGVYTVGKAYYIVTNGNSP